MRPLLLLAFMAIVVLLAAACVSAAARTTVPASTGASESPTYSTESRLAESLAMVPIEFADKVIEFADYSQSRVVSGLEEADSTEAVFQLDTESRQRLTAGVPIHQHFKARINTMIDLIGVDVHAFGLSMWSWQPGNNTPTFLLARGEFESENIGSKLLELDYKQGDYKGTAYYWLNEDFTVVDITHPLGLPLNRIAILDDRMLAAPATGILEQLIDAQQGDSPYLLDSKPHRALSAAIGEGLLGGTFMPPQWIVENWNTINTRPVDRLDRYLDGPDQWGELSAYPLALFGYRVQGDAEETVIALYYPDPAAAARDSGELEKRWNSFYYDPVGPLTEAEETQVTRSCSPISTTVIEETDHSVLVGTCPVIRSDERDPTVKGPSLWSWLFSTRELQFLVQDVKELKPAEG